MPRSRILKPEFLQDERLHVLSLEARLYLLGAASLADRNGVLEHRPMRIRIASMPHDQSDAERTILELVSSGILLVDDERRLVKIGPWDDWFRAFPNEPIEHDPHGFSRGTSVEQAQASGMLVTSMVHASDKDKDKEKKKEKKDSLFPIRDSLDSELQEWYLEATLCYPTKDDGHNSRSGQWESRRVQRDSPQAQKNFSALVSSGAVTARELYVCAWLASEAWRKAKDSYNFVPNLSSFFSSGDKAPWCNWIEEARKEIETA